MLDIAVIGAGRIGRIHARNVALHSRARLVGVSDPDTAAAGALAESLGARVMGLEEAFGAAAVMICSPTPTHADYIERAAAQGRAVFCEKPVDLDAGRVRACLEAVRRAGVPLMVGFNRRFDPSFAALQRRLAAGEIGRLETVTITSRDPSPPPATYAAQSGGIFRDMTIHDLDMARFLLGEEPAEVYAAASSLVDPEIGRAGDFDTVAITLKTAGGAIGVIQNSRRATYGYDQRIEVHASGGMLRAGNATATTVESADAGGFRTEPALPFFLERYAAAYREELDAFVSAVLDGKPATPTGEDGLKALLLADAATESARTGRPVAVR